MTTMTKAAKTTEASTNQSLFGDALNHIQNVIPALEKVSQAANKAYHWSGTDDAGSLDDRTSGACRRAVVKGEEYIATLLASGSLRTSKATEAQFELATTINGPTWGATLRSCMTGTSKADKNWAKEKAKNC